MVGFKLLINVPSPVVRGVSDFDPTVVQNIRNKVQSGNLHSKHCLMAALIGN